eukprot:2206832-Pleurochrysis_carterae.AAC.1
MAGTVPSPGNTPTYFALEKIAAQAASPRATVATAGADAAVAAAAASACSVSSAQRGWRTAASAARRAAWPVSAFSCDSLAVEPAGRSRHDPVSYTHLRAHETDSYL